MPASLGHAVCLFLDRNKESALISHPQGQKVKRIRGKKWWRRLPQGSPDFPCQSKPDFSTEHCSMWAGQFTVTGSPCACWHACSTPDHQPPDASSTHPTSTHPICLLKLPYLPKLTPDSNPEVGRGAKSPTPYSENQRTKLMRWWRGLSEPNCGWLAGCQLVWVIQRMLGF